MTFALAVAFVILLGAWALAGTFWALAADRFAMWCFLGLTLALLLFWWWV